MIPLLLSFVPPDLPPQVADPAVFAQPLVERLNAQWPNNRAVNIVCHGHSVPAGYFQTPKVQTFDAYPHLLHVSLKAKHPYAVVNVIVTAIGGENSEQGAARFDRDVLSLHPDVVTIDYSLNDRGIGLARAKTAWVSMIESAKRAGIKVILLTPSWDLAAKTSDPQDPLLQHAEQVRSLAKQFGVGLADSTDAFLRENQRAGDMNRFMSQSNHPNRQGHEIILRGLLPWFGLPSGPS